MRIQRIFISISATAGIITMPAMAEINYNRLFLTGAATPAGWSENLPEELTPVGGRCFVWDGWLDTGDFKFINTIGDWGSSVVAATENQTIADEGPFRLVDNTGDGPNPDFKFYNPQAGYIRIIADLGNLSVKFRRPAVGIVGDAALGWGEIHDVVIPVFADDEGHITWSGQLRKGEVKFLASGATGWHPCYNAPWEGCILNDGGHWLKYNAVDVDDYKYLVEKNGLYTLEFDLGDMTGDGSLKVTTAQDPEFTGDFRSMPGRYLTAIDRQSLRLHFGPMPSELYIVAHGDESYQRLHPDAAGSFSAVVTMKSGCYYKLCYNPADRESTALSPDTDTPLTPEGTSNMAPMHGYSYTVDSDGDYLVKADFNGTAPRLSAEKNVATAIDKTSISGISVKVCGRTIIVSGEFTTAQAFTTSGVMAGDGARMCVSPGFYIVRVDGQIFKIAVK